MNKVITNKLIDSVYWSEPTGWGFWFRIFGRGFSFTTAKPNFSERYGYEKSIRIFGIKIKYLAKGKS